MNPFSMINICGNLARSMSMSLVVLMVFNYVNIKSKNKNLIIIGTVTLSFLTLLGLMFLYDKQCAESFETLVAESEVHPTESEAMPNPEHKPKIKCAKIGGVLIDDKPGYYLLNGNSYSKDGISYNKVADIIKHSKLNDIYHQHAQVTKKSYDTSVYFGKGRVPLHFDKTYKFNN